MHKKHDYEALLQYMRMLEEGYSIRFLHKKYGIGESRQSVYGYYTKSSVHLFFTASTTRKQIQTVSKEAHHFRKFHLHSLPKVRINSVL